MKRSRFSEDQSIGDQTEGDGDGRRMPQIRRELCDLPQGEAKVFLHRIDLPVTGTPM